MIEGSGSGSRAGSGSKPLTNGSGSGSRRPKHMWIRWIRQHWSTVISKWSEFLPLLFFFSLLRFCRVVVTAKLQLQLLLIFAIFCGNSTGPAVLFSLFASLFRSSLPHQLQAPKPPWLPLLRFAILRHTAPHVKGGGGGSFFSYADM